MHISRSINVTPDHSIFTQFSRDLSINSLSKVQSNPSLSKRFASCRGAYTSFKTQQKKLKQIPELKTGQKGLVNYVQEYTSRLKRPEISTPVFPAEYYEEIQECFKMIQDSEESKLPTLNKLSKIKGAESLSDILLSSEAFIKLVSKSEWFESGGRIQCTKNFLYFQKILLESFSKLSDLLFFLTDQNEKLSAIQNPSEKLLTENKDLKQRIKTLTSQSKSFNKLENELKSMYAKERFWNIDKVRLDEELENMKKNLIQPTPIIEVRENEDKSEMIQKKNEALQKLSSKIDALKYKLIKTQYESGKLKDQLADKTQQLTEIELSKAESWKTLQDTKFALETCQNANQMLRDRLGMTSEDLFISKQTIFILKALKDELKFVKDKYEELANPVLDHKEEETVKVSLEDALFKVNFTSGEHAGVNYKCQNYQFVRPSYREMINPAPAQSAYYTPPFKHWIYFTVRGMYDSKFYEHSLLYSSPNSRPSRFVDFVYSWLCTYGIDENSRNVIELEWWKKNKAEEIRYMFLLGLSPEISKTSWELSTFKEFLNESRTLDELSFFLHCRFLFLQSPQMLTNCGKYSRLHMINLQHVFEVLEKVFYKLRPEELEKIKQILISKSKTTRLIPTIDLAIVMRIILEVFKQEKNLRYSLIRTLFERVPKDSGGCISYFNFRNICKNLSTDLNELEIVKFYRDCWTFSSGMINSEIFNVIGNENCIFFKLLKLSGVKSGEEISNFANFNIRSKNLRKIVDVVEGFKAGDKEINMIKFGIDSMGVLELSEKFGKISGLMMNYMTLPPEDLWIWTLEDLYQRYWSLVVNCQSAFIESNSSDIKLLAYKLRKVQNDEFDVDNVRKAATRFVEILFAMNLNKIKTNIAARKIQQVWKMKAGQNLGLISTVVKSVKKFKGLMRVVKK